MEGIIYKILDYKEKSSLVYLIGPYGLDSLLVRGAKSYKSGKMAFCEFLNCVAYEKDTSNMPSLISYEIIDNFANIKKSFMKLKYASIILEVARQSNDARTAKIYEFTKQILEKMAANYSAISLCFIYMTKMLKVFGIMPDATNLASIFGPISDLVAKAYATRDYQITEPSNEDLKRLIDYYVKADVISTYNILKMLEV